MLARLNHPAARRHRLHDATAKKGDPTGTADVRRRFKATTDIRWSKVKAQLRATIIGQDMLGLDPSKPTTLGLALQAMTGGGKVTAFQTWLDATLARITLEHDTAYLDPMIQIAYNRAVARALRLTKSTTRPANATDAVATLQQVVMVEMQGINEAVSQRIVREAGSAVVNRSSPKALLAASLKAIDEVGVVRSRAMVETYVVKTFATGTLDQFDAHGVKTVGLVPETVPKAKTRLGDFNENHDPDTGQFTFGELRSWAKAGGGFQRGGRTGAYGQEQWARLLAIANGDPVEASRLERELWKRAGEHAKATRSGGLSPDAAFADLLAQLIDASPTGTGPGSRGSREQPPSARTIRRIKAAQRQLEALVEVDIVTAGDEDVCQDCQDLEDEGPYSIDEARSLIPAHPYCRCAFVPTGGND